MDQWRPVPRALITKVGRRRWTRENPASELAGFCWALDQLMDGYPPSIRDVADYAGWTHWHARQMLDRVREHHREWVSLRRQPHSYDAQIPHEAQTPEPNHSEDLQPPPAQIPHDTTHESAHRERGTTTQDKNNTQIDMGRNGTDVDRCWHALETIRLNHSKRGRRRKLGEHHQSLRVLLGRWSMQDLEHAWRWWWESGHHIPSFCQQKGLDYGTFLNPVNHARYQAIAQHWTPGQAGDSSIATFLNLTDTPT